MSDFRCETCGKEFRNNAGLGGHKKFCKGIAEGETRPPSPIQQEEGAQGSPLLKRIVEYRSPKIRGLRIIVRPSFYNTVNTPTGSRTMLVPGKVVEFRDGVFKTDDPEIIEFLSHYSNPKFPVLSVDDMKDMGRRGGL
jgi:hypothetical protein